MQALTRRSFLAGLITAPAIVHAGNIMKVRAIELPTWFEDTYWMGPDGFWVLRRAITNGLETSKIEKVCHSTEHIFFP